MIIQLKDKQTKVASPGEVYTLLRALLAAEDSIDRDKEHFWVFYLTTRKRIKMLELITLGTLSASLVHPREVFTRAVAIRCHSIVIAHNHPSGDATPSHEDVVVTKQIKQAGLILDIQLVDHIVIGEADYTSFAEQAFL